MTTREDEWWRIRVTGVVQGVGYRPFVYRIARRHELAGWVRNDPEGVLIEAGGPAGSLRRFTGELSSDAPGLARVHEVRVTRRLPADHRPADGEFVIVSSGHEGARQALLPPDTHVCADCLAELFDPADRRHRYPFINCTNCGPRYSIVRELPYDRPRTTMAAFTMCERCEREYHDPADRRYHAQPNACPACGPALMLAGSAGQAARGDDALQLCASALRDGQIAAIKSIGGFHLAVDAANAEAVALLRKRKRRDSKPFAVMARDLETARRLVHLSDVEADMLASPARPILLARKRGSELPEGLAPRNPNLGVMLPSAPHHHLLLAGAGLDVLVMTSGNVSGYPIAYRNEDALAQLFEIADVILYHNRDIEIRVDDSVARVSAHPGLAEPLLTFVRRARGYAPYPVDVGRPVAPLVAFGAELKTTVALSEGPKVYLSQHIGDLKNDETFQAHQGTARHIASLYDLRPAAGAYDLHPQFRSTRASGAFAGWAGQAVYVQHHHAHMASCMAENQLTGRTLGVVFDGAGYGTDGTIWGGEFLLGDYAGVDRVGHLRHIPLIGGDKAVHEPIRTGLALALDALGSEEDAVGSFPALGALDGNARRVFAAMAARGVNSPRVSSMGRLFDGIAALLGVCGKAEYEAQGPIELEGLLGRDLTPAAGYSFTVDAAGGAFILDPRPVVRAIAADLAAGVARDLISRRFHTAVTEMVRERCRAVRAATGVGQVVLSGGVFLNEFVLVNCLTSLASDGFAGYCQRQVPANDGGIALGQLMVADARLNRKGH